MTSSPRSTIAWLRTVAERLGDLRPELVFLGGAFYSASMLPPFWETVTRFNPVLYLISGFRWSFFGVADVPVGLSLGAVAVFLVLCLSAIAWIFRTGWRLRP